jgi:hypothetical protein
MRHTCPQSSYQSAPDFVLRSGEFSAMSDEQSIEGIGRALLTA